MQGKGALGPVRREGSVSCWVGSGLGRGGSVVDTARWDGGVDGSECDRWEGTPAVTSVDSNVPICQHQLDLNYVTRIHWTSKFSDSFFVLGRQ